MNKNNPRPPNDRGQGRKPVKAGEKTVSVTMRLAESHEAKWTRLAESAGVGRADWFRGVLEAAPEPRKRRKGESVTSAI